MFIIAFKYDYFTTLIYYKIAGTRSYLKMGKIWTHTKNKRIQLHNFLPPPPLDDVTKRR